MPPRKPLARKARIYVDEGAKQFSFYLSLGRRIGRRGIWPCGIDESERIELARSLYVVSMLGSPEQIEGMPRLIWVKA
jgi:hypothetical protein